MTPDIIMYLLSLRHPDSDKTRLQPVCYLGFYQLVIPNFPPGATLHGRAIPVPGTYARVEFSLRWGTQMMPNVFETEISQYGSWTFQGLLTQRRIHDNMSFLVVLTQQEPSLIHITNISPIFQYYDIYGEFLYVSTPQDMEAVVEALRRMHTSEFSEKMQSDAALLLAQINQKTGVA